MGSRGHERRFPAARQVEECDVGRAGSAVENVHGNFLAVGREPKEAEVGGIAYLACFSPVAPIPDEAGRRDSGLVGQRAICRHREIRLTKVPKVQQCFGHCGWFACGPSGF